MGHDPTPLPAEAQISLLLIITEILNELLTDYLGRVTEGCPDGIPFAETLALLWQFKSTF